MISSKELVVVVTRVGSHNLLVVSLKKGFLKYIWDSVSQTHFVNTHS